MQGLLSVVAMAGGLWLGGSDLCPSHKPESRQWFMWGLGSYCEAFMPPAQLHPN